MSYTSILLPNLLSGIMPFALNPHFFFPFVSFKHPVDSKSFSGIMINSFWQQLKTKFEAYLLRGQ